MQAQAVFHFNNYKDLMAQRLVGEGRRGQLSRAAQALGCQPSFLSRVLNSEIHLSMDHAFGLAEFWALPESEHAYFRTLVEYARAAEPKYRASLKARLDAFKKDHESLAKRTAKPDFSVVEQQALYFSSWHWSALHFLSCIPEYQSPKALAARLGLNEAAVTKYLRRLQEFGMVREANHRWEYAGGQFHIPRHSPFVSSHHQNWRARAVIDAQNSQNDSVHYTTVLTLSHADLALLKDKILELISESERIARPSSPEEAAAFTCDLFRI